MPVILDNKEDIAAWLDVSTQEFGSSLAALLKPYAGKLECYPVPTEVGNVKNNSAEFVRPVSERKGSLASFFAKSPGKSPAKKTETASESSSKAGKRKRSTSPPQDTTNVETIDPHAVGNDETNAPLPVTPAEASSGTASTPLLSATPHASPGKKRKVDAKGDAAKAKANKNEDLDQFIVK